MNSANDQYDPCELGHRAGAVVVARERCMRRAGCKEQADEISLALYHAADNNVVIASNTLADSAGEAPNPGYQARLALAKLKRERGGVTYE